MLSAPEKVPCGMQSLAMSVIMDITEGSTRLRTIEMAVRKIGAQGCAAAFEVGRGRALGSVSLEFHTGDITHEVVDAIVNPAGPGLVDLAIRRAAGPELLEAFHRSTLDLPGGRLLPGQALRTPGFSLPAAHVIHCRPPVYADGPGRAREQLSLCHTATLGVAREQGLASISFPAVGTGVFRYPAREAAEVALEAVIADVCAHQGPRVVRFVLAGQAMFELYVEAARTLLRQDRPPAVRRFECAGSQPA